MRLRIRALSSRAASVSEEMMRRPEFRESFSSVHPPPSREAGP
jgi:hypothetical protein